MAEKIIYGRVKNKIDSLAKWSAANPIILNGEIALVRVGDVIKFKIGDGTSRFNDLPFNVFNPNALKGSAVPSTDPGTPTSPEYWIANGAGTYTHFGGLVVTHLIALLIWDGTAWSVIDINLSVDLSSYATTANLAITNAAVTENTANLATNFAKQTTYPKTGQSYDITAFTTGYQETTSVYSGWDTPVGVQPTFDRVIFTVRARATAITEIWVRIAEINNAGTVLSEKHITGLNVPANTAQDITCDFDAPITSANTLRLMYVCNQLCDRYGIAAAANPYPVGSNALASYKINGVLSFASFTSTTGGSNRVNYAQFYKKTINYVPTASLLTQLNISFPDIANIAPMKVKTDRSLQYDDVFTGTALYDKASGTYPYTTSTYSAWGGPIGNPQNFNSILYAVKARTVAITSIYWEIRVFDKDGTLVDSGTQAVNVPISTSVDILFKMTASVPNVAAAQLWFGVKCNQQYDVLALASGLIFPGGATYGQAAFGTGGSTSVAFINKTGTSINPWASIGNFVNMIAPTDEMALSIARKIVIPTPPATFIATAEVILPSLLHGLEGKEFNIYFENCIKTNLTFSQLEIDVTSNKGKQYNKYYRYTPISTDAGVSSISITVSFNGVVLATWTGSLLVSATASGTGVTRKFNWFSDSTLASGQPQAIIISEQGADPMTISFQGTLGSGANKHEGRSGWKISDYATVGRTFYKFNVTGLGSNPSIDDTYTNNSSTFKVVEINVTAGAGYINTERTIGTNLPTSSGNLTKATGSGPSGIAYTSTSVETQNPLWNGSAVSYSNYLTTSGISMSTSDWFGIHLGINDFFGFTDDTALQAAITTAVSQLRTILTSVHTTVSGIRCMIMLPIMPVINQDGFGNSYSNGQTLKRYIKNIQAWQKRLIAEFDNVTERTAGNYLLPLNCVVDRENNFAQSVISANARNSVQQVITYTNGVHPIQSGYDQMGDQVKAAIKYYA